MSNLNTNTINAQTAQAIIHQDKVMTTCLYNDNVICPTRACFSCGWNDKVKRERIHQIRRKHRQTIGRAVVFKG